MTKTAEKVRLERLPQVGRSLTVLRAGAGRILGLSVMTTGPALGHGFEVGERAIEQVAEALEGIPGRWTHGGLSTDGLARHLGHWTHGRVERFGLCRSCLTTWAVFESGKPCSGGCDAIIEPAARAVGDFAFTRSGHSIQPDGLTVPAPVYLMDRAEESPRTLGISIVALFDFEELEVLDAQGKVVDVKRVGVLANEPRALERGDWVADPAANPIGLHAGTGALSELSEAASLQLRKISDRVGPTEAKRKAQAFLDRFFAGEDDEEAPVLKTNVKGAALADPTAAAPPADVAPADPTDAETIAQLKVLFELPPEATNQDLIDAATADEEAEPEEPGEAMPPMTADQLKVGALEKDLAAAREKAARATLNAAREKAAAKGLPIDADTSSLALELLRKGDEASEKLASKLLELACADRAPGGKPLANTDRLAQERSDGNDRDAKDRAIRAAAKATGNSVELDKDGKAVRLIPRTN